MSLEELAFALLRACLLVLTRLSYGDGIIASSISAEASYRFISLED